jgi:hypothetical protein
MLTGADVLYLFPRLIGPFHRSSGAFLLQAERGAAVKPLLRWALVRCGTTSPLRF